MKSNICFAVFFRKVPMFGLEGIWRNGKVIGHIRRADFGYAINKTIAYGYIRNPERGLVSVGNSSYWGVLCQAEVNGKVFLGMLGWFWVIRCMSDYPPGLGAVTRREIAELAFGSLEGSGAWWNFMSCLGQMKRYFMHHIFRMQNGF